MGFKRVQRVKVETKSFLFLPTSGETITLAKR